MYNLLLVYFINLYMFRTYLGPSSGGTTICIQQLVCLFVSMGVHGKPQVYCSLLAYCTARFERSNFGHQMPRHI
jgi:hypothetical protein